VASLRLPPPEEDIAALVTATLRDVAARGDAALVEQIRRFDCADFSAEGLRVDEAGLQRAADGLAPELCDAITTAAAQVRTVASQLVPADTDVRLDAGQHVRVRTVPVASAGCYVPGGRAAYPSSLIMAAVPAQVAGVDRVVVASPPGPDGRPAAVVLACVHLLGISEVYAVGGAGAIAALAYGTQTVPPVSVITGPGNAWVAEAKRQVSGTVGIDSIAGPSEVVVIADDSVHALFVALDLLAQREHGADSPAILATHLPEVAEAVERALLQHGAAADGICLVECASLELAVAFAEAFAPEHLQLNVRDAGALADTIRSAGAVFIGRNGGTAFGDYVAGSNHVLPTGGSARFASALGPSVYLRRMAVVDMTQDAVDTLTPHLSALAIAEGFTFHRRSAEARTTSGETT
jgi:histidinol dehydrogenase